jgi:hypothetical protein
MSKSPLLWRPKVVAVVSVRLENTPSEVVSCAEYLRDNPHFLADIEACLKAADLGISALRIKEVDAMMEKTGETRKIGRPFPDGFPTRGGCRGFSRRMPRRE